MDLYRREIRSWFSHRTGMEMPIVQYGHWGHALLMLPTAQADFLEHERFGLIGSMAKLLHDGKVRIFSINSINNVAWMNHGVSMRERSNRQAGYSAYIEWEVVPYIRECLKNGSARIGITGASFGAFHAGNQFFRRPDLFDTLIGMSGFYDLSWVLNGYSDENVYFNNPMWYVENLHDGHTYDLLRHHSQIHLITGQGAWEVPNASRRFSALLHKKGVPHNLDLWGHDVPHDWPTWRKMLPYYVGNRLGW